MKGLGPGRDQGKATPFRAVLDRCDAAMGMQHGRAEDAGWDGVGCSPGPIPPTTELGKVSAASSAMRALQQVN